MPFGGAAPVASGSATRHHPRSRRDWTVHGEGQPGESGGTTVRVAWTPAKVVAAAILAIGLGTLVGALILRAAGEDGADSTGQTAAPSAVPADVAQDLTEIETALNSGDPELISAILTREAAAGLDTSAAIMPAGSTVDIEDESFVRSGDETAYVSADVAGPEPGRHLILLWRQDDAWRVVATAPES